MSVLLYFAAIAFFTAPLLLSTYIGYNKEWWTLWGKVDILPFPAPFSLFSPIWGWYLLCWAMIAGAIVFNPTPIVPLIPLVVLLELGYLLFYPSPASQEAPAAEEVPMTVFSIWHNSLTEELVFRGLPLLAMDWMGLHHNKAAFWGFAVITSMAFGVYHWCRIHIRRLPDTFICGLIYAFTAWHYGIIFTFILHLIHNILAVPMANNKWTLSKWRQGRFWYLVLALLFSLLSVVSLY
ncbi:type II CAAX prenyl endopeptidase Rce1 family protein [Paenibacillus sp.]|jgi:hypothetical protein|uniref:CPBP family glutamic-type intramembrane protease n=1 Tax=Paenibacillus sp. TaxID=58172 RepID=UPI00281C195C|nr:CPBP family glutamic-type intramembrane protease [Paenibacillus sp.]MDR0268160.1 CPBP family intramembrane metalloprotease [Paenibacillus sp.]